MSRRNSPSPKDLPVSLETVQKQIHVIRGRRVVLDQDLATLYGVLTRRLNEQLRRNLNRFPEDFAFRLTLKEFAHLKSQFATSSSNWGGRRKLPYVFTEHGVIMAATVLNSSIAIRASLYVVRAFVLLRESLALNSELARKIHALQQQFQEHDETIDNILVAIRDLTTTPPTPPNRQIGFVSKNPKTHK